MNEGNVRYRSLVVTSISICVTLALPCDLSWTSKIQQSNKRIQLCVCLLAMGPPLRWSRGIIIPILSILLQGVTSHFELTSCQMVMGFIRVLSCALNPFGCLSNSMVDISLIHTKRIQCCIIFIIFAQQYLFNCSMN
jgi:hypothetical protein